MVRNKWWNIECRHKHKFILCFSATLFSLGCLMGSTVGAFTAQQLGRKWSIFVFGWPAAGGWLLLGYASAAWMLYLSRLVMGFACSVAYVSIGDLQKLFKTSFHCLKPFCYRNLHVRNDSQILEAYFWSFAIIVRIVWILGH